MEKIWDDAHPSGHNIKKNHQPINEFRDAVNLKIKYGIHSINRKKKKTINDSLKFSSLLSKS